VLFVGTKKQAQDTIRAEAERCAMPYVNNRWLGGTLTNFHTIKQSLERLKKLEETITEAEASAHLKKKERLMLSREHAKLLTNLAGIRDMKKLPDALFVIDPDREAIAVAEANRLKIPAVGVVDTNCDPDRIAYCIPGNDDAIRAIRLFCGAIADAVGDGVSERAERDRAAGFDMAERVAARTPAAADAEASEEDSSGRDELLNARADAGIEAVREAASAPTK
jgi:small subunit ribosomal protein S2